MVALMEETVFHQEYVIVLMVGVEIHVKYVCKIIYEKWFYLDIYIYIYAHLYSYLL